MCGIAGIVTNDPNLPVAELLAIMQDALAHRGPDGLGAKCSQVGHWRVGLAHTRLAILDLSEAGAQPMADPSGCAWITYNGEIYNYSTLRAELTGEYPFRSDTDTEVILAGFRKWGRSFVRKLRGMYALALMNVPERCLLLARDPFGMKPLYVWHREGLLLFASEVRAILATGLVPRRLNPAGIADYLATGSISEPHSIISDIELLEAGSLLEIDLNADPLDLRQSSCEPIYRLDLPRPECREAAVEDLNGRLAESVRAHMVSDVPTGVFLSGGVDSTAIVRLARDVTPQLKTFTVTFSESEFAEAAAARSIARAYDTVHEEIHLTEGDVLNRLDQALSSLDQPSVDGLNTYMISAAVRSAGIGVALSGLGGDELFGGYPSFGRASLARKLTLLPTPFRRSAARWSQAFGDRIPARKARELLHGDLSGEDVYRVSRQLFGMAEITQLAPAVRNCYDCLTSPPELPTMSRLSWLELSGYMRNTLLRDTDNMSMTHSLEVRMPFVDREIVPYVLALPDDWKTNPGRPKSLLVDALAIPAAVWKRRKMGFTLPISRWLLAGLCRTANAVMNDDAMFRNVGLEGAQARSVWNLYQERPQPSGWSRPWALFVLARWASDKKVQLC